MNTSRRRFLVALLPVAFLLLPSAALANSNRIFISTTGNNAGDCSNPLTPCFDFGGALLQVNAGGEIIAQATGPYGPLNITKAVTISGPPGVVIYSGHQVSVNAPGATVVLRGLTIDGNGAAENGIDIPAVGVLHVESCVIANFANQGIDFKAPGGQLFVKDTIVRGNSNVGIWVRPTSSTARASIEHCRIETNGFGLFCSTNAVATMRDSILSGNLNTGCGVQVAASAELNVENCTLANNSFGISSDTGTIRVSNTTVTDNGVGLTTTNGGTLLSRGNNTVEGNATNGSFTGPYTSK